MRSKAYTRFLIGQGGGLIKPKTKDKQTTPEHVVRQPLRRDV
jgi:hypothetical protein